ncbi:hypothetical protein ES703_77171 [subsurface metagenome]
MKKLLLSFIGVVALAALILPSACKTPAQFEVTSLDITPKEMVAGDSTIVTASVENVGETEGIYHAVLTIDGVEVETKDIPIIAGAKQDISFQLTEDMPGTYKIELGELIGTLKVLSPAQFRVDQLTITPDEIKPGETVSIRADLENTGEAEGIYQVVLKVNGRVRETRDITLAGGVKKEISFQITEDTPGICVIKLGELIGGLRVLRPAKFRVNLLSLTPNQIAPGGTIGIKAGLENAGEIEGTYYATLMVNGVEVETKDTTLAGGAKRDISFQLTEDMPGTYKVELGGLAVTFKVIRPAEFKVVSHTITPNPAKVGGEIEIRIDVQNLGEIEGTYVASLIVDGIVEETKEITLGGGVTKSVSFAISRDSPGNYEIEMGSAKDVIRIIQPVRLSTGTYLVKKLGGGLGELTIENGLDLDAVVILVDSEEPEVPLMAVYIRSEASYTMREIRDGTYVIYFSLGEDWDNDSKKFIGKTVYQRFEDELHFKTTGGTYTTYKATLHPVIGGTAGTEYLDEDEFPALD